MVLRRRFWVDREVQGVLIGRIIVYWVIVVLYFGLGSACFQFYQNPKATYQEHFSVLFSQFWPWLPSIILLLPLVVYDVIRLSNLFVGPVYRLRRQLHDIADNPECRPMGFRTDDYWLDLVAPMNRLHSDILRMRTQIHELKRRNDAHLGRTHGALGKSSQAAGPPSEVQHRTPEEVPAGTAT